MKTLWRKTQENSSDRISHAWAPLILVLPNFICEKIVFGAPRPIAIPFACLYVAETEIDCIEDEDKIKKQTGNNRHGPRLYSSPNVSQSPTTLFFILHYLY